MIAPALLALTLAGATVGSNHAVVFVFSDLRGYLGPCGCSENMRGGMDKAAKLIADASSDPTDLVVLDAGDSLFPSAKLAEIKKPEEALKAQTIARLLKELGLRARIRGERDLALGPKFLESLQLPEIRPRDSTLQAANYHTVGVVTARSAADLRRLSEWTRKLRGDSRSADVVIALFPGTFEQAQAVAKQNPGVDLIVPSHAEKELDGEEGRLWKGAVPVVAPQSKGRELLRVDVWFSNKPGPFELVSTLADTQKQIATLTERLALLDKEINQPGLPEPAKAMRREKIAELVRRRAELAQAKPPVVADKNAMAITLIPLEATLPGDPKAASVIEDFHRKLGELNLAEAKAHGHECPRVTASRPGYVGNDKCLECHDDSFPVWRAHKHAHAYQSLVEKGRQYDLECIGCHVTGYEKPGGVCRVDKVTGREGVGCEACHGPGSVHSDDPTKTNVRAVTEATCRTCHDPENSPHFDFKTYLPLVLGPGHGKKKSEAEKPR